MSAVSERQGVWGAMSGASAPLGAPHVDTLAGRASP
jgi:hypothetical protein